SPVQFADAAGAGQRPLVSSIYRACASCPTMRCRTNALVPAMMRSSMAPVSLGSARRAAVLVIVCAMAACARAPEDKPEAAAAAPAKPAQPGGIDLAGMDRSVAPGDDFFAFANGTWAKTTEIPADRSSYGVWAVLSDRAQTRTRELIEALARPGSNPTGDERKIADYFTSYMDEATIESKGLTPVQPFLAKIAAIQ